MKKLNQIWKTSEVNQWFIFLIGMIWLIAGIIAFSLPSNNILHTAEAASTVMTPTVLYFQGNTEEGCTGSGMADFTACDGPVLSTMATLSTNPAAQWGPVTPALNNNVYRSANHNDPNWIWKLSGATRIGGPMTTEWWASCGGCGAAFSADLTVRLWADGVKQFLRRPEKRVKFII